MKKLLALLIIGASAWLLGNNQELLNNPAADWIERQFSTSSVADHEKLLSFAFENRQSDLQVQGSGTVLKLLKDDLKGSRHQRFLLQLNSGQTLLIAHNIDLAPRIDALQKGDQVEFFGEYEWNDRGGVIHWTHRDPNNRHPHGWLRHRRQLYQ